ncbi:MAG: ribosome recycling factor [Desulfobacterales bacterium]|nr:ribosome recycling factor [Desulfobacterales bacterium]
MIDLIISEASEKMDKSVDSLKKDLKKIRTGRASLSLLDDVRVNYYNTPTPLNQLASLSVPESRMITIQPWDPSAIKEIEKAIMKSNLGLTPSSDGKIIRITMPPLTEDRRKEIVKQVNKVCEEYRIAVRNIRREANDSLKTLKKDGDASEDDVTKAFDEIQKLTDEHVKQIDDMYKDKEKEILEV